MRDATIWHDGQISKTCPAASRKIYRSARRPDQFYNSRISSTKGALATSRTRGEMRWTRRAQLTLAPDADGEVVWSWRRGAGAKLAVAHRSYGSSARCSANDGGKRAVHRGELAISRNPSRRESRNASAGPVCSCAFPFAHFAHETAGAACIRLSLRPLFQRRAEVFAKLGRPVPRERGRTSDCHHSRRRVIQYSRDANARIDGPQRTGSSGRAGR